MYISMHACVSLTFSCFLSFVGVCSVSELRENRNQSFTRWYRIRLCTHLTVCNDFTQQIWHTLTLATTMSVTVEQLQLRWICICVCKRCVCVCVCVCLSACLCSLLYCHSSIRFFLWCLMFIFFWRCESMAGGVLFLYKASDLSARRQSHFWPWTHSD